MAQQAKTGGNPFAVESDGDLPVGVQLSWRLRALILTGRLASGEPLPSVRRLAAWASVNVNTVRAVYESLEEEGLIHSRQGQGTFVADRTVAQPDLEAIAIDALRRGQDAGVDPRELARVVMACATMPVLEREGTAAPIEPDRSPLSESSETIEVRLELRRQIARLEAELAAYVRDLPAAAMPTAPIRAEAHIAGVGELERTRDTLIAQLSVAQKSAEQRVRREGEERARRRALAEGSAGGGVDVQGPLQEAISWWQRRP